jgi:hypothetical protein
MLSAGIRTRLYQGKEIYGGLAGLRSGRNGLILPSETRTVATIARALAAAAPSHPRLPLLVDALVTLGRDDGWGGTNADSAALLALSEQIRSRRLAQVAVKVTANGSTTRVTGAPVWNVGDTTGAITVVLDGSAGGVLRADTRYVPQADGSQTAAVAHGFVVSRTIGRVRPNTPIDQTPLATAGSTLSFGSGDVIEDHVQVVNPEDRNYVAITVPLAAGMEPLNPRLATAPPEATPTGRMTLVPSYADWRDDAVTWYYETLPRGTYDFFFRAKATTPGEFIQPAASAEAMYDATVNGRSNGAKVVIAEGR